MSRSPGTIFAQISKMSYSTDIFDVSLVGII